MEKAEKVEHLAVNVATYDNRGVEVEDVRLRAEDFLDFAEKRFDIALTNVVVLAELLLELEFVVV